MTIRYVCLYSLTLKVLVTTIDAQWEGIFFFFFFLNIYLKKKSPPVHIGTNSGVLLSDLYIKKNPLILTDYTCRKTIVLVSNHTLELFIKHSMYLCIPFLKNTICIFQTKSHLYAHFNECYHLKIGHTYIYAIHPSCT